MFNKSLEKTLKEVFLFGSENRHEFVSVEHLLLALLDNIEAADVLIACGSQIEKLKTEVRSFIDETTPLLPSDKEQPAKPTAAFQRVLQRAIIQMQSLGKLEVGGAELLLAILGEPESQAVYFLNQQRVTRRAVSKYLGKEISQINQFNTSSQVQQIPLPEDSFSTQQNFGSKRMGEESSDFLDRYAVNLNEMAKLGKIDPLIGRSSELQRATQVLCRRRKNNPLLVGEAGVGKTAIAEGLADLIVKNQVPKALSDNVIYSLDLAMLMAGTKYRGDFEKRFNTLVAELKSRPEVILFIDEIHMIVGAGAASGGSLDAANLIKPLLARGEFRCMGSTTFDEYRNIFEKDGALSRRFQRIDVVEPSADETFEILSGLRGRLEKYHNVKFTDNALKTAVKLANRYMLDRQLPDKAIDVLDEAGAFEALQSKVSENGVVIDQAQIERVVARMVRIPEKEISSTDTAKLRHLDRDLKMLIFGQDKAVDEMCSAIRLSRSGLREEKKTVGSFLLAGPTGVGKTEVAKQLARLMGVEFIRFDMSEYMESHTISRLIGAPPGYVGHRQAGLLTDAVNKNPHAVLLLDEVEKAHPDIYNILLQVMDYATLTDNNGKKADFQNITLIMTTNVGSEWLSKETMGFKKVDHASDLDLAVGQKFTPEFRNRLDAVVHFNPLDEEILYQVAGKFMRELEVQLNHKKVEIAFDQEVQAWLVEKGFSGREALLGGRAIARVIQKEIKRPVSEELLGGQLTNGGKVFVDLKKDHLAFDFKADVVAANS